MSESILEKALLEAEQLEETMKSNAKEILSSTMKEEIQELVKESWTEEDDYLEEQEGEEQEVDTEFEMSDDEMDDDEMSDEMETDAIIQKLEGLLSSKKDWKAFQDQYFPGDHIGSAGRIIDRIEANYARAQKTSNNEK